MSFWDFLDKRTRQSESPSTRVLVCSVLEKFSDVLKADGAVYSRVYPSTTVETYASIDELLRAVKGYDIVHLFADASPTGVIEDRNGNRLIGTKLIEQCCAARVRLLWIASDNEPDAYIKGFKASKPINLVMTIDRNGSHFGDFLGQLLSKMSSGKTMPTAWAALSPQTANDPRQASLPATIFSAGLGSAKFR